LLTGKADAETEKHCQLFKITRLIEYPPEQGKFSFSCDGCLGKMFILHPDLKNWMDVN
jgi:hypothetical protein